MVSYRERKRSYLVYLWSLRSTGQCFIVINQSIFIRVPFSASPRDCRKSLFLNHFQPNSAIPHVFHPITVLSAIFHRYSNVPTMRRGPFFKWDEMINDENEGKPLDRGFEESHISS